jgi:hypothetical protein
MDCINFITTLFEFTTIWFQLTKFNLFLFIDLNLNTNNIIIYTNSPNYFPKNQDIWVQWEQTKQVALRLAQSRLKNEATAEFNCALRVQNKLFPHTGQVRVLPATSTVWGSAFLNRFMVIVFIVLLLNRQSQPG